MTRAPDFKTKLEYFQDMFRLMLVNIEDERQSPEYDTWANALNKALNILADTFRKPSGKAQILPDIMRIEKILNDDLGNYPIANLVEKLLDGLRSYKMALQG